ncbi:hypothetical protein ASPTUDRAFT_367960 [Aspergillus tubingensis CBS 134.48]|uniref:Uncharacterized protein n=1 Tax=Aspergillus tubingensis (strain CBS 134.48) TaxID=767770 RepID=A0A1L9NIN1_ASPTC|nr:hypothetical protein ASPTUDRAFT_367960 [Aspergillus tubingensis CBS 134.48]
MGLMEVQLCLSTLDTAESAAYGQLSQPSRCQGWMRLLSQCYTTPFNLSPCQGGGRDAGVVYRMLLLERFNIAMTCRV